ncbi:DUF1992 domain-containing protein [Bacillus swezeyi]|uniref:DUF1992 domain-containing protein n=1 Tax=Bacillus swezeyi TaxID=1925020 RepID=A0A5M8RIR8_9BACI|nr:DUF1992 domain-containing protein [Bacillus swezeyi]KAA6447741.1 DUF1992 domain-containing protein [Bacillus swezeyi]KAA6473892.1 DUF1992 domain-containing protein [Bacillus swezeyi]TYS34326.1 DUF1992 domain-containing protein [Bacillus swezeyi]
MDFSSIISEDKIKQAIKDGEFDGLPGMGKPLKKDEAAHIPENLRMAYRVMKNAGMAGDEGALKKELMTIDDLIAKCTDENERERLMKRKTENQLRLDRLAGKKGMFSKPASAFYKDKIYNRLGRK